MRRSLGAGPDDFLVGYIGLHGMAQGLQALVGAAERLAGHDRVKFIMIGDGVEKEQLVAMARDKGLKNMAFHDPIPKHEVPAVLASCDASVVPLVTKLPERCRRRFYEALAAGVPVVVVKHCEGQALVEKYDLGRTFEPLDDESLAEALLDLAEKPESGRDNTPQLRGPGSQIRPRHAGRDDEPGPDGRLRTPTAAGRGLVADRAGPAEETKR